MQQHERAHARGGTRACAPLQGFFQSSFKPRVSSRPTRVCGPQQKAPNRGGGGGAAGLSTTDAVALLPGLEAAGGSVTACDVRFTRVHDFAYAPQPHAVFELLDVLLVHAWVVDAADLATRGARQEAALI